MNWQTNYCRWMASIALLIVLAISGCGKKNDEAATNTSNQTASATPAATTSPATSPAATSSPASTTSGGQGVKPQGANCPSDAPIKALTTKKRGKVYHDTKFPDYKSVKPEICFKDIATAQKAGYSAPKGK